MESRRTTLWDAAARGDRGCAGSPEDPDRRLANLLPELMRHAPRPAPITHTSDAKAFRPSSRTLEVVYLNQGLQHSRVSAWPESRSTYPRKGESKDKSSPLEMCARIRQKGDASMTIRIQPYRGRGTGAAVACVSSLTYGRKARCKNGIALLVYHCHHTHPLTLAPEPTSRVYDVDCGRPRRAGTRGSRAGSNNMPVHVELSPTLSHTRTCHVYLLRLLAWP